MTLLTECKGHAPPPPLRRTVSETSLSQAGGQDAGEEELFQRHYSTLPETLRCLESGRDGWQLPAEEQNGNAVRFSLYQSPHLLLLQGYSQQHVSAPGSLPGRPPGALGRGCSSASERGPPEGVRFARQGHCGRK